VDPIPSTNNIETPSDINLPTENSFQNLSHILFDKAAKKPPNVRDFEGLSVPIIVEEQVYNNLLGLTIKKYL